MQNDAGEFVDLYCPRKCSASNRLIHAKDHASVQLVIADVDPASGRAAESSKMYVVCGAIRRMGESDDCIVRLTKKDGILTKVSGMSARSSSGSWSGGGCAAPDIIDLDKFMRGAVRPSRRIENEARNLRDQLVVDAGGVERKIPALGALVGAGAPGSGTGAAAAPPSAPVIGAGEGSSSSSSTRHHPKRNAKRYSHDSGLSDGSYAQRKHRPHRRSTETGRVAAGGATAGAGSSSSLRAFRAVCERALLDQQAQIARVAQLCERLTEKRPAPTPPPRHSDTTSPRTSDVTSTSRSTRTRDPRRKDKHRTEECKTYKIIMNKLDELNRRFAARATSPGVRPAAPRRRDTSSGSVSMSDKLVSTEPTLLQTSHGGGSTRGRAAVAQRGGGSARAGAALGTRAVTNTCMLDIAPQPPPPPPRRNITTESVVACDSGPKITSACDARCGFDLEDPIHLYSQAKRLQALPTHTRRARSAESAHLAARGGALAAEHAGAHVGARAGCHEARDTSLCAMCRGYWRSLRQYLATQLFCTPEDGSH